MDGCGGNDNEKDDQKKIAGEIPAIGLSPFQILYQYEDSS
jgi:hypothetical protein